MTLDERVALRARGICDPPSITALECMAWEAEARDLDAQCRELRAFVERAGAHLREDGFDWHTDAVEWGKTGLALGVEARALLDKWSNNDCR